MAVHFLFQFGHALGHLRQWRFVAFGQFLHALGQGLADAIHLALNGGFQRGQPFVVHHQRLDLGFAQFGVMGVGFGVQVGFGVLELLLELGLLGCSAPAIRSARSALRSGIFVIPGG